MGADLQSISSIAQGHVGYACYQGHHRPILKGCKHGTSKRDTVATLPDFIVLIGDFLTSSTGRLEKSPPHPRAIALWLLSRHIPPVHVSHDFPASSDSNFCLLDCFCC